MTNHEGEVKRRWGAPLIRLIAGLKVWPDRKAVPRPAAGTEADPGAGGRSKSLLDSTADLTPHLRPKPSQDPGEP